MLLSVLSGCEILESLLPKEEHEYIMLEYDDTHHWYECDCGDKKDITAHIAGAPATETTAQVCTVCGYVLVSPLGHIHTLHLTKVNAKPQTSTTNGNIEYYICSCNKWFTDNTATIEIVDKNSVVIPKDNATEGDVLTEYPLVLEDDEMSFHFMMLGNHLAGDCVYIKAGDTDILIDAGSRTKSVSSIQSYINRYMTDDVLEYVIVTHSDQDHIDGFVRSSTQPSIFDIYECQTIIDFNRSNKDLLTDSGNPSLLSKYYSSRDEEVANGATHYTALDCYNNTNGAKRIFNLAEDMSMEILYNYYYDHKASDENDYSVCVLFKHGDKNFLFTGDLEEKGEEYLVQYNNLPQVELFKAGHHGSPTSSNDCLLSIIKPKISVACCCAGSAEYGKIHANYFPSQAYIDRISQYTDKVFVPVYINTLYSEEKDKYVNDGDYMVLNGNIMIRSLSESTDENGQKVEHRIAYVGSNNSLKLKDTDWFKKNRTTPSAWQN